jgi:hypothetical protein
MTLGLALMSGLVSTLLGVALGLVLVLLLVLASKLESVLAYLPALQKHRLNCQSQHKFGREL